jgi:hypothetical protein
MFIRTFNLRKVIQEIEELAEYIGILLNYMKVAIGEELPS